MITNFCSKNVEPDSYYFPIVSAVATSLAGFLLPLYTDWPGSWVEVVASFWLTSAFIADLTITFTLVWDLVSSFSALSSPLLRVLILPINVAQRKRRTGHRSIDNVIRKLIRSSSSRTSHQLNIFNTKLWDGYYVNSDDTNRSVYFLIRHARFGIVLFREQIGECESFKYWAADTDYILNSPYHCEYVTLNRCISLIVLATRSYMFAVPLPQLYLTSFLSIANCRNIIFARQGITRDAQNDDEVRLLTCFMFI